MAKITIIAAIGENRELGKDNDLIWHLKGDLQFFKEITTNHKIIMGMNTFKSLPGFLPNREHIILSHRNINIEGAIIFNSLDDLLTYLNTTDEEIFIIGGASIYKLFINLADELILTEIEASDASADVYFPEFNKDNYERKILKENSDSGVTYKHISYRRVK